MALSCPYWELLQLRPTPSSLGWKTDISLLARYYRFVVLMRKDGEQDKREDGTKGRRRKIRRREAKGDSHF